MLYRIIQIYLNMQNTEQELNTPRGYMKFVEKSGWKSVFSSHRVANEEKQDDSEPNNLNARRTLPEKIAIVRKSLQFVQEVPGSFGDDANGGLLMKEHAVVSETNKYLSRKIAVIGNAYNAGAAMRTLLEAHYDCTFLEDEFDAIRLFKRSRYDLIIADFKLVETDSLKLLEIVRLLPDYEKIPFLVIRNSECCDQDDNRVRMSAMSRMFHKDDGQRLFAFINTALDNSFEDTHVLFGYRMEGFAYKLLWRIREIVAGNLEDEAVTAGNIAYVMNYTQRNLSAIVKKATDLSLVQYILKIRMTEACRLIVNGEVRSIKEARYAVGIESVSYFNKKFKQHFGMSPNRLKK